MIELLRLADSRVAMVGGLATNTLCLGTLATFALAPTLFFNGHSGVIILLALSITAPVLASTAVILSFALASRFDTEERSRRMLMAAGVLHGGVQLATLLGMLCDKGPSSLYEYFLSTWLLASVLALSLIPVTWVIRKIKGKREVFVDSRPAPPPGRL